MNIEGNTNKNIHITISNIPQTDFDENGNFCVKNIASIFHLSRLTMIFWCQKIQTGRYLLYHQKYTPDAENIIQLAEILIYLKQAQTDFLKGDFFFI